jgi:hypothetical protein
MAVFSFIPRHKDVFLTMTGIVFCGKLSLFYVYFRGFRFAAPGTHRSIKIEVPLRGTGGADKTNTASQDAYYR